MTEQQAIELLKSKDKKVIAFLYDNYSAALYGVILKIVQKEEVAEDVLQETFVKIWKNGNQYDRSRGRLFTWLINIARNTAIDMVRSKRFRQSKKSTPLDNNVYNNETLQTEIIVRDSGLEKVINSLDEKYRTLIDLAYFQGYTQKEIAKQLNIPIGTVKSRIRYAIKELRKILNTNSLEILFWNVFIFFS